MSRRWIHVEGQRGHSIRIDLDEVVAVEDAKALARVYLRGGATLDLVDYLEAEYLQAWLDSDDKPIRDKPE